MAEATAEYIMSFAATRARDAWEKHQQPYLLAQLSPDLMKEGVNYKTVLGEQRLKEFLQSATTHVKVVFHPTQKAKIGLIPPDKDFEFATEPPAATNVAPSIIYNEKIKGSRRRYIVSNFLQLLSELDDDEIAQVQIPTQILTKLIRD